MGEEMVWGEGGVCGKWCRWYVGNGVGGMWRKGQ